MPLHIDHRPDTFDEFVGNSSTVKSLQSILKQKPKDRPHSILFQGDSGCGKTTLARILKKELDCSEYDFIEVNMGNVGGVETAREIIKNIRMKPMKGDVRIYLLDEIQESTKGFQGALLKPLEDTPDYVYFILCTTNPQKLQKAIRNRCTTYVVEKLDFSQIEGLLLRVAKKEKMKVDPDAILDIAEAVDGCPRQALVILGQVIKMDIRRQRRAVKNYLIGEKQTMDLCRALFAQANWNKIQDILKDLKEEPETVRRAIIGYMSAVASREKHPGKVTTAAAIYNCFRYNFYDNGRPGLVFACWEATHNNDVNF